MNTSVHIPKDLSDRLSVYLKQHSASKNRVIVEAIAKFIAEKEVEDAWHPDILDWQGATPSFDLEVDRDFTLPSREDVF